LSSAGLPANVLSAKGAEEPVLRLVKPVFCIVLGDGENWSVQAEWPDGFVEQVDIFKAHFEAANWINTQSEIWLRQRQG
jgi:hypothetical protein